MSIVKPSRKLYRPPDGPFTINYASPQANGLVLWQPLFGPEAGADRYVDRARGLSFTKNGTPVWTADERFGQVLLFDDASTEYLYYGSPLATMPFTMACWFLSDDTTISQGLICISSEDDNAYHGYWLNARGNTAGDPVQARSYAGGVASGASAAIGYVANTWYHAVGIFNSATSRVAYLNGGNKGTDTTETGTPASLDNTTIGGFYYWNGAENVADGPLSGRLADVRIYNRALTDAEVWQLYDPATRYDLYLVEPRWWVGFSPAGAATLVIQDSAHTHTSDNIALTQHHVLAINDSTHTHSADNIALTQHHVLVIQDAAHTHSADNIALTQHHVLAIDDAAQGHSADNLALVQHHILAINDSSHTHSADNIALTQHHVLAIDDANQAQSADNIALTQHHTLAIQDAAHTHSADNLALTQHHVLTIADALHAHSADNITLGFSLVIADATHTHSADNIALVQHHILVIAACALAHSADNVTLSVLSTTPTARTYTVEAESRTYTVGAENRTYTIEAEDRTYTA